MSVLTFRNACEELQCCNLTAVPFLVMVSVRMCGWRKPHLHAGYQRCPPGTPVQSDLFFKKDGQLRVSHVVPVSQ